jgi:hypothetical protein
VAVLERPDPLNRTELVGLRQNITAQNTNAHTGQATDYPPNGTWWYGLRIIDQAGNCITEENKDCSTGATNGQPSIGPFKINASFGCTGDFDQDGDVDGSDLAVFASDYGRTDCDTGPICEGDFDNDNDVDGSDLAVFAADFGRTICPMP